MKLKKIEDYRNFNFTKYCGFDTETTGFLKYEGDKIFSFSVTNWVGDSLVLRFDLKKKIRVKKKGKISFKLVDDTERNEEHKQVLIKFLLDTSIIKIMHNAKFEITFCRANGFEFPPHSEIHDTMIMSQYVNNIEVAHALDYLALKHFKYPKDQDEALKKYTSEWRNKVYKQRLKEGLENDRTNKSGYQYVPKKYMDAYQVADTERTVLLYIKFWSHLFREKAMWENYLDDIQMIWLSAEMEADGFSIYPRKTKKLMEKCETISKSANRKIKKILGYELNVNSPQQVSNLLYNELGNKPFKWSPKRNADGNYNPSTDKDVLVSLRDRFKKNPIYDLILKERAYKKGVSDLSSYLKLAHPETGLMHPNIKTNEARTGRQSVSDPPLQCIAKEISAKSVYGIPARQCFRAEPNHIFILSDYSGIELRLIIELANELEMIDIINSDGDVHDVVSEEMYQDNWRTVNLLIESPNGVAIPGWLKDINPKDYGEDYKNLRYQMRAGCKDFEFGTAYGGGMEVTTAKLVGLSRKEKKHAVRRFESRWPGIAFFTNDIIQEIKKNGFIYNSFGRKLYVERGKEYAGSNYKVQSTAAYILKRAQIRIHNYFKYELDGRVKVKLPVHDEIIKSFPRDMFQRIPEVMTEVEHLMVHHPELKIRLDIESDYSITDWASTKPLKFEDFIT